MLYVHCTSSSQFFQPLLLCRPDDVAGCLPSLLLLLQLLLQA
jgi:hypothetical protein